MLRRIWKMSLIGCFVLGSAACGDDGDDDDGMNDPNPGGASVAVTVQSFSVSASPATAQSGSIKFRVHNSGTATHEFVVVKTDLAPEQLPVMSDEVDEEAAGIEVIDEIEDIEPNETAELSVNLTAGKYVLICNLEGHYSQGMHTPFTVQ